MSDFTIAPDPHPSGREAARDYILDMIEQLAQLARQSGETRLAILLDAIHASDGAARRTG